MNKLLINGKVCKNSGLVFLALITLVIGASGVQAQYMAEVSSKTTGNTLYSSDQLIWITFKTTGAVGMSVTQYGQPGFLKYVSRTADKVSSEGQEITVTYKCALPMGGLPFKVGLAKDGKLVQEITKQVTCSSMPLESSATLQELSSDLTGIVGATDTVSITARAGNANGMTVTQFGQPGSLSYVSRTAASITSSNQDVTVTYKCVASGSNLPLKLGIVQNGQLVHEIAKTVSCAQASNGRLQWIANDPSGRVGSDADTVSITSVALDATGSKISQYGKPGYLAYVSRTSGDITSRYQEVTITYKCVAAGSSIPLSITLVKDGQILGQITKPVTCLSAISSSSATLQELSSDLTGTVGATDTVSITARAGNANGMSVTQFGQPGSLSYVSRTAASITGDSQNLVVTYKCVASGSNLPLKLGIVQNGQLVHEIAKTVSCAQASNGRLQWLATDPTGTVGSNADTVSITAQALDASGSKISQWGQPGSIEYVSRTSGDVSGSSQEVTVTYKCVAAGSNIPLKLRLVQNGQMVSEVTKMVTCKTAIGNTYLQEVRSDTSGTVGDSDPVSITASAVGARGLSISQWGQPGILAYSSRTASTITADSQTVMVTYKCAAAGTGTLELSIVNSNQKIAKISKTVTCK